MPSGKAAARGGVLPVASVVVLFVGLWFGAYELVERFWLQDADPKLIHGLHILRGVGSSLLAAAAVAWSMVRHSRVELPARPDRVNDGERVLEQTYWLIQLRWLAIIGVMAAIASSHSVGALSPGCLLPLWGLVGLHAVFNGVLELRWWRGGATKAGMALQLGWDSLILACLLHSSGGLENPFYLLFLFHAQVGVIVLETKVGAGIAAFSALLFLALGFGEAFGVLEHHPLLLLQHFPGHPCIAQRLLFIGPLAVAFLPVHLGAAHFTGSVMARLRRDQQRVVAAERLSAVGRIVGLIAHEVNNPIGVITTKAHLALARPKSLSDPEKMRGTMEVILRQAERVAQLVRSLLTVSLPASSTKEGVDVADVLDEVSARFEGRFHACGVELKGSWSAGLLIRDAKYSEIVQVFSALIHNALELSPRKSDVRVVAGRQEGRIQVRVADRGPGIPQEDLPFIFKPFFAVKGDSRGAGLDLALCMSVVKSLGGDISVQSEVGKGTEFVVRLPALSPVSEAGPGLEPDSRVQEGEGNEA